VFETVCGCLGVVRSPLGSVFRWLEKPPHGEDYVERRRVNVPGGDFLYDPKTIPPEWRAWLSKTRAEPPTPEEMEK
jgi:hypothetical protein